MSNCHPQIRERFCLPIYPARDPAAHQNAELSPGAGYIILLYGLGIAVLPELILEKFPGSYDSRMLSPEAYRTLGIGIRSLKEAGPLTRFVIDYLKHIFPPQIARFVYLSKSIS